MSKLPADSVDVGQLLHHLVQQADAHLDGIDNTRAQLRPARPGATPAWSACELLGHMIDSAANNHQRFVRAAFVEHLEFPGYDQNAWVTLQGYGQTAFGDLRLLWRSYNLHLARVLSNLTPEVLDLSRKQHCLDRIAWSPHPADQPGTLRWFAEDYVGHLRHHLLQLGKLLELGPSFQADVSS